MRLQLITLDGTKLDEDVYQVLLPTATGQIAIFDMHEPLVTAAEAGVITVVRKQGDLSQLHEHFATEGGIAEIDGKSLRILVDEASHSSEIIEAETRQALERAIELRDQAQDELSLEHAQSLVARETVRLKVAELRRHSKPKL